MTGKRKLRTGYTMRKDGTLQYSFTYKGKRLFVYGQTQRECQEKAEAKKEQLKEKGYIENNRITLRSYFEEWKRGRIGTVKSSTIYDNEKKFSRIPEELKNRKIIDIEKREIISAQKTLQADYTTAGVNAVISLVYTLLESARKDGIIKDNPAAGISSLKRTEPKARDTIHRALTLEEQTVFFNAAKDSFYYPFFAFLVNTGMRSGEAAALTWSDIDLKNRTISITKTVSRASNETFIISDTPKTKASCRKIALTMQTYNILQMQYKCLAALDTKNFDNRIFMTSGGGYITASNTGNCIKKIIAKAEKESGIKIEPFSCHAFRDTFATRFVEQSNDYKTLQSILGHSSITMTMDLYAHALPETVKKEMQQLKIII